MFRNSGYLFLAFLVVAIAAFWPTYFSRRFGEVDVYTHVHVVLMIVWFSLLISQPFLIRRGRLSLHRLFGRFSYALVPAIVAASFLLSHWRLNQLDERLFLEEGHYFFLPFQATFLFVVTYVLAIVFRRTAALHARFMIGTGLTLIDPVVARILFAHVPPLENQFVYQLVGFGLTNLVLVILIIMERGRGQGRAAFPAMLAIFMTVHLFWFTGAQTQSWLRFVTWFRDLPLTH